MDSAPERITPLRDRATEPGGDRGDAAAVGAELRRREPRSSPRRRRSAAKVLTAHWPLLVYLGSRVLVITVAAADGYIRHHSFLHEFANWDGNWYSRLAISGYPRHASHLHTTLGFFPLYPIMTWLLAKAFFFVGAPSTFLRSVYLAGVVVSTAGGLVATAIVQRLATGWWGAVPGRRAAAVFCLFPGSVVFSMVYAEGLMIPLVAGCILALERRRWLLAGILAGLATATEPQALVLVVVCSVSALAELRRRGWGRPRALAAPVLALSGVSAFAVFLWFWTGTPFASLIAQRHAWHERTDPLALVHLVGTLVARISHYDPRNSVYNPAGAVAGLLALVVMLAALLARRQTVSGPALTWTLGISFLAVTTERLPPNSRILLTAFPAVLVLGTYLKGRRFWLLQLANAALLAATAWLTFVSHLMPP